ncbi:MAG: amidase [Lautropia sp.]
MSADIYKVGTIDAATVDRAAAALSSDDALALARRIVGGEFSAVALLEACLSRIAAQDPRLGAVCLLAPDVGRAAARAVDAEVATAAGSVDRQQALLARRPFAGVPLLLKDLATAALGLPSGFGSVLYRRHTGGPVDWPVDAELVARYRAAGFVPFGRTTTPELGISASTEARAYGRPTRNPWRAAFSAGGSSGGAGAAAAARMVPLAHATDGAGSIRIPASCCGLVGFKPSRALMPTGPLYGEGWGGMATEHVLTHSVRDCAVALAVSAGADRGAGYPAPMFDAPAVRQIGSGDGPAGAPRLRIGLIETTFEGVAVDPRVRTAVRAVADTLAAAGHSVAPVSPGVGTVDVVETVIRTMAVWTAAGIDAFCATHGLDPARLPEDVLEPGTRGAWRLGHATSGPAYVALLARGNQLSRAIAAATAGVDLPLMPTLAELPAAIGRFAMNNPDYLDYRLGPSGLIHYSPFTPLANLTGRPAISLPLGEADGLPIGIQLVGEIGADATLLRLAAELEICLPWRERRPPEEVS